MIPNFNKNQKYTFEDPQIVKQKCQKSVQEEKEKDSVTFWNRISQNITLLEYHCENKDKLVYKRYPEYNLENPTTIGDKQYFATYVAKLKKFLKQSDTETVQDTKAGNSLPYDSAFEKHINDLEQPNALQFNSRYFFVL